MDVSEKLKAVILKRAKKLGKGTVSSELCALGLSPSLAEKLAAGRKPGGLSKDSLEKLSGYPSSKQKVA